MNRVIEGNSEYSVHTKGASHLEKLVNTLFEDRTPPIEVSADNKLQIIEHDVDPYNQYKYSSLCPVNLNCSDPPTKEENIVLTTYRKILDRNPDPAGFQYWLSEVKNGLSEKDLVKNLKTSLEYENLELSKKDNNDFMKQNDLTEKTIPSTVETPRTFTQTPLNQCVANYLEPSDLDVKYSCPQEKPICYGYGGDSNWGKCVASGGIRGHNVTVLGKYNIHMNNKLENEWTNITNMGKWIWFTEGANITATTNSNALFQYNYYFNSYDNKYNNVNIYVVSDNICYVYVNSNEISSQKYGKVGKYNVTLSQGINRFEFFVSNSTMDGKLDPTPAGLLVMVTIYDDNDHGEHILFNTDESWTYLHTLPKPETDLLSYQPEKYNEKPDYFKPTFALYNKKHKGFLKCNADTRFINRNTDGKITLLKSHDKKLPASLEGETAIFKMSKTKWYKNGKSTFSLYNCANQRFLRTNNKSWTIDMGVVNNNQDLLEVNHNEMWVPYYHMDHTISFHNAIWKNRFIGLNEHGEFVSKVMNDVPDDSCIFEIVNIDCLYIGPSNQLKQKGTNTSFEMEIPYYIDYVGNFSMNQIHYQDSMSTNKKDIATIPIENDNFYTHGLLPMKNEKNQFFINRIDEPLQNKVQSWDKYLYVIGINKDYVRKSRPLFQLIINGDAKELAVYNNTLITFSKNNVPFIRSIFDPRTTKESWLSFSNPGNYYGLELGEINKSTHILGIDFVKRRLFTRPWDSVQANGQIWKPYGSMENIKQVQYNKQNESMFVITLDNKMYEMSNRNSTFIPDVNLHYFKLYTKQNGSVDLYGIDKDDFFVYHKLNKDNKFEKPKILAKNVQITHFDIYHSIVFAIGVDGRLYCKPIGENYPFVLYNSDYNDKIAYLYIYNCTIYITGVNGNTYQCPILLN